MGRWYLMFPCCCLCVFPLLQFSSFVRSCSSGVTPNHSSLVWSSLSEVRGVAESVGSRVVGLRAWGSTAGGQHSGRNGTGRRWIACHILLLTHRCVCLSLWLLWACVLLLELSDCCSCVSQVVGRLPRLLPLGVASPLHQVLHASSVTSSTHRALGYDTLYLPSFFSFFSQVRRGSGVLVRARGELLAAVNVAAQARHMEDRVETGQSGRESELIRDRGDHSRDGQRAGEPC